MSIIRYNKPGAVWSSWDRMSSLRDLLDNAFQLAGTMSSAPGSGEPGRWAPPLDVYEDESRVVVALEAAGMKKDAFDISLHEDTLTVTGERRAEEAQGEGESFRSERFFGAFSRTVQLPTSVQADAVSAEYVDGVLRITLPKAEEARPRKIQVEVK